MLGQTTQIPSMVCSQNGTAVLEALFVTRYLVFGHIFANVTYLSFFSAPAVLRGPLRGGCEQQTPDH